MLARQKLPTRHFLPGAGGIDLMRARPHEKYRRPKAIIPARIRCRYPPFVMARRLLGPADRSKWGTKMSMSVGGTTGFSNNFQWRSLATTSSQAKSDFTPNNASENSASNPTAASNGGTSASDSSVDGIQVDLPNGFSVGVFRISQPPDGTQGAATLASSDSASSAQMLQAIEQLVAAFANAPGATSNGAAPANPESFPAAAKLAPGQSMDGIDVGLPNGYSAEVYHIDQASGGPASASNGNPDDQMVNTMAQLVANLSGYPATAASAYNKTATDASSVTGSVNSVA
jgi:hypothetical protein